MINSIAVDNKLKCPVSIFVATDVSGLPNASVTLEGYIAVRT